MSGGEATFPRRFGDSTGHSGQPIHGGGSSLSCSMAGTIRCRRKSKGDTDEQPRSNQARGTSVIAARTVLTRTKYLSKGQLVDVEGRLQTRQWDGDAGKRH